MESQDPKIQQFWNERAALGNKAGTNDLILKELEMRAISQYIKDGMKILEPGCGNGLTAMHIASNFKVDIDGFDYAQEMISAAQENAKLSSLKGTLNFEVQDVGNLESSKGKYDLIYTERVLINIKEWEEQCLAIKNITSCLKNNGIYVMCENSVNGLEKMNLYREKLALKRIDPPWHNRYFNDEEIDGLKIPGIILESTNYCFSTFYFLSRVINAWMAEQDGKEPPYDSELNKLSLLLPSLGDMGQTRIWVWRKQDCIA